MQQLEEVITLSQDIIAQARKTLKKQLSNHSEPTLEILNGESDGRLTCPFCLYTSKKNKFSAKISNSIFKCFACGKVGRVNDGR